jgi:hypothetical protein
MNSFRKIAGIGLTAFGLATWAFHTAMAEPLMTMFTFSQSAYKDGKSNEIVVTITRTDQDPAAETEAFTVNCRLTGGDAVENRDFTLSFNGSMWELGKVSFPPGVREQSFTIYTRKTSGPNRTLLLALSDPDGPSPAVTGNNATALVTIVNQ